MYIKWSKFALKKRERGGISREARRYAWRLYLYILLDTSALCFFPLLFCACVFYMMLELQHGKKTAPNIKGLLGAF